MPAATTVAKATSTPTDPYVTTVLEKISEGAHVMSVPTGKKIFSQGDRADAIYFVQTGTVKVSVVSSAGKEAVIAILGPHGCFGEGSLVGQSLRMTTATTLEPATVFQIEKRAMLRALHAQPGLCERFMASLLKRNIDLEEDLCDQLFNDSEKRLARVLLKLARLYEHNGLPDATMPTLSHETLAEMVGTTRSRVTHFMNKFRKMGLIDYNGHLIVRTERLTDVVLDDQGRPLRHSSCREEDSHRGRFPGDSTHGTGVTAPVPAHAPESCVQSGKQDRLFVGLMMHITEPSKKIQDAPDVVLIQSAVLFSRRGHGVEHVQGAQDQFVFLHQKLRRLHTHTSQRRTLFDIR